MSMCRDRFDKSFRKLTRGRKSCKRMSHYLYFAIERAYTVVDEYMTAKTTFFNRLMEEKDEDVKFTMKHIYYNNTHGKAVDAAHFFFNPPENLDGDALTELELLEYAPVIRQFTKEFYAVIDTIDLMRKCGEKTDDPMDDCEIEGQNKGGLLSNGSGTF